MQGTRAKPFGSELDTTAVRQADPEPFDERKQTKLTIPGAAHDGNIPRITGHEARQSGRTGGRGFHGATGRFGFGSAPILVGEWFTRYGGVSTRR